MTTFFPSATSVELVTHFLFASPAYVMYLMFANPLLTVLFVLVAGLIGGVVCQPRHVRRVCTVTSFAALLFGLIACFNFDFLLTGFQFSAEWKTVSIYNNTFTLGADGLSMIFIMLTLFIFPLLFLSAWSILKNFKAFFIAFLLMELLLVLTFLTTDLLYFYIFFESLLIPMFMVIGVWGARERKIKAAYLFFLYTLFGSLIMLFGLFQLYLIAGTTDYEVLQYTVLGSEQQNMIWLCFFIAFAVKMPLYPFHLWLPEAHVEAPTVGSMLLASLLLKMGGYGFLRFSLTFLAEASAHYSRYVILVAALGVIYGSLATIRQADLKRIIAYSSVAHMNLTMLGMFSGTQEGMDGAIFTMVAHGVVSAALFFCVGVLYDHYHSRLVSYYGGLATTTPVLATFFLLFTLANMGFPGTSNFIGEILMFLGIFNGNNGALILALAGIVLGAVYSVWLFNRVFFGTMKRKYLQNDSVLRADSIFILAVLAVTMLVVGLSANVVTLFSYAYCAKFAAFLVLRVE